MTEKSTSQTAASLHTLPAIVRKKKRLGRGIGSKGAKSGRGMKGQKARSGFRIRMGFEGGQTPLYQRLPKARGATKISGSQVEKPVVVLISQLASLKEDIIGPGVLRGAGLLPGRHGKVKLVGSGKIERAVTVRVHATTKSARLSVEEAGGKVEIIG